MDRVSSQVSRLLSSSIAAVVLLGCSTKEPAPASDGGGAAALVFRDPETCRRCHAQHVSEWEGAMHAYAAKDPVFHAIADLQASDFGGEAGQFCTQCHTPPGFLLGETRVEKEGAVFRQRTEGLSKVAQAGVSCDVCHSATQVLRPTNAELLFQADGVIRGPFADPIPNEFHSSVGSALHVSGKLCAACHNVKLPFNFKDVPLESTGIEWENEYLAKGGDKQCQDCHMPSYEGRATPDGKVRTLHRHTFVGVDVALIDDFPHKDEQRALVQKMLEGALQLNTALQKDVTGRVTGVSVSLRNLAGHAVPSGVTTERRLWVAIDVTDGGGKSVFRSGHLDANGDLMDGIAEHSLDPGGDPSLWVFSSIVKKKNGELTEIPHRADEIIENLIRPHATVTKTYAMPATLPSGSYRVAVKVQFRAFQPFFLRLLEKHQLTKLDPRIRERVPLMTMAQQALTFEVLP